MTLLLMLILGVATLFANTHEQIHARVLTPTHEDLYVGQPVLMNGVSFGREKFDFSFSPENRTEIAGVLRQTFAEMIAPIFGEKEAICLVCYINGINVFRNEFDEMMRSVHAQVKGNASLIGLYNATRGIATDAKRVVLEKKGFVTVSMVSLQNFLGTAFEYFSRLNSRFLILMLAHSEGGLLLDRALDGLGEWGKEMAKKHLVVRTFGSIHAITTERAKDVLNVYSDHDQAAFRFVKEKFHLPNHTFRFYPTFGVHGNNDHAFLGPTYQHALMEQMEAIFKCYR